MPIVYLFHKHDVVPNDQKNNMGYLVMNYMVSSIESMLNSRLNELTQQANPPFIEAGVQDGDYLVAKTKGAFAAFAAAKEDGIILTTETLMREIDACVSLVSQLASMPVQKLITCADWNQPTMNVTSSVMQVM